MKGWKEQPLEELTEPDSPITYGVVKPGVEGDVLFVRGGDLTGGRVLESQLRTITQEVSDQYKRTLLRGGELLICLVGQPGQVAVAPESLAGANIARQVGLIRLRANVDSGFVSYFLQSPDGQQRLGTYTGGSVQQVINLSDLRTVLVPVPPLAEQQRIVGVLDEAMAGIATARAHTETNLQNARALFESHLHTVFTQRGPGWVAHSLESLCDLFVDSAHRTPKYQDEGIPALRPRDVVDGKLNLDGARRVSEAEYEIQAKRHKPSQGDIVYSRELSYGWAAALPETPRVCLSQGMCLFRPSSELDTAFLLYVLNGSIGREQAMRVAVGAAHPHINLGDIKSYLIPVPPLVEQRKITRQLDALSAETQRLAALYERKLAALAELKKSLLHQAFRGNL